MFLKCVKVCMIWNKGNNRIYPHFNLIFVDPCIIVNSYRNSQQDAPFYQNVLFHVYMKLNMFSSDTPPIIRSSKLHQQPPGFHTWKVVGRWVCWTLSASRNLNVQQPFTYAKPEVASAVLSSWLWAVRGLKHVEFHINIE